MDLSLVEFLFNQIPSVWEELQQELQLAADAKIEFGDLKDLIYEIGDFLKKAILKEFPDEQLKRDIRRMRNFLYDCEDAIEDLKRPRSDGRWRCLSYLSQHFKDRTFTVEARGIKAMLQTYKDNHGRTVAIENRHKLSSNHASSGSASHGSLSEAFIGKADSLVGIERPIDRLVELLTADPSMLKVIFVHGAQGVGKTSLVAAMLHLRSKECRFKYCVWIQDSCELANTEAVLTANAKMWNLTGEEANNQRSPLALGEANNPGSLTLGEAFKFIKEDEDLKANKFSWVLVLDDACKEDVFPSLKVCLNKLRPNMLVTTRFRSLKSRSENLLRPEYIPHDFEHVLLSKNESRALFRREMGDTYEDHLLMCENSPILKDASDRILRRCKGLPLAIQATCTLLRINNQLADAVRLIDLSGMLEEEVLSNGHVVYPNGRMMTLRMDHLLDVCDCLLYLGIFPLDRPIRCNTMKRLWMAEGFIKQEKTVEAKLQKLLQHNIIQEKKTCYGTEKTCRVHNLLHQIIISKSKDEDIAMIVAYPDEELPENIRYLSFHSPMRETYNGTSVKRLRSLHVFKTVHPLSLKELLKNVERLKLLHIQRHLTKEEKKEPPASFGTFPQKILQSKYLRYLSLRGTDIDNIPRGIKVLKYLETLDLRGTLVSELPEGILELKALRHLLVSRSNRRRAPNTDLKFTPDTDLKVSVKAPSKLGDLTLLQKLCMIELKSVKWWKRQLERKQWLEELGKLTNLQRLGLSMLESTDANHLCSSIKKLTNLVTLRLIAAPRQKIDLSNVGSVKVRLQRLHLTGSLETLPELICTSDTLVKLVLKRSQLTVAALQQLGKLLSLKHLELEQAFDVKIMKFEAGKFQQLCFLGLNRFDELASIQVDEGALPTLERLSLARCKSLTTVPNFIIMPPTKLKWLVLCDMPENFERAVTENEGVRKSVNLKIKHWRDEGVEDVITLTADPGGSPWVRPCKK